MKMRRFTDEELLAFLDQGESDRIEFKESFSGEARNKARETVCAFANDLAGHREPGVLFIGSTDRGKSAGLEVSDELLRALSDMKTDGNILPLPTISVEKRTLKGGQMAVVTVLPADAPPVRYRGRVWVRTASRQSLASAQDERVLNEKRQYNDSAFDISPVPSARLEDLSRSVFENDYLPRAVAPEDLDANDRSYTEHLASFKMIASPDDTTPTVLGLLALGKNPQDFMPGARIQFLRIDGVELADPVLDEQEIRGNLVSLLQAAESKLHAHNRTAVDVSSAPTHIIADLYPPVALSQILYNAVLHRNYAGDNTPVRVSWFDDRIEIISPGGPYGSVSAENFGDPGVTGYRNPNLAVALRVFGYVQIFGRGIGLARQALRQAGRVAPEFKVSQEFVYCIIRGN